MNESVTGKFEIQRAFMTIWNRIKKFLLEIFEKKIFFSVSCMYEINIFTTESIKTLVALVKRIVLKFARKIQEIPDKPMNSSKNLNEIRFTREVRFLGFQHVNCEK